MGIRATVLVDDDRWAKRAYGIRFDDEECQMRFGRMSLSKRSQTEVLISAARDAGFNVTEVDEIHY